MNILSPQMVQDSLLSQVDQLQQNMGQIQRQAATGLAFQNPQDNPVGTAAVIALQGQQTQAEDIQQALTTGQNTLQVVAGALGGMTTLLQRAQQLAITATEPGSQGSSAATVAEAQALAEQLAGLLNTQTDGYYVFAASNPTAPVATSVALVNVPTLATVTPWQWQLPIAPGQENPVTINGFEPGVALGTVSAFSVAIQALNALIAEIPTGNTAAAQSTLHQALDAITTANALVGTYQDINQQGQTQMQTWLTTVQTQIGTTQDANMAQVVSQLTQEETVYQAALQAGNSLIKADLWTVINP